jgi:hypothetical protein
MLAETVREYDGVPANAEINRFREMPSLGVAIKAAAESRKENGKPYEHQGKNWNFWPDAIQRRRKLQVSRCT